MTLRTGYLPTTRRTILQDADQGGLPIGSPEAKAAIAKVREAMGVPPRKHTRTRPELPARPSIEPLGDAV